MKSFKLKLTTALAGMVLAGSASADFIAKLDGNDCAGAFGIPFGTCTIPFQYDPKQSPVIAKFDVSGGWQFNIALFPTVAADDFILTGTTGGSGTWTYLPDPGDPIITFFVAKGGNFFNLFSNLGDANKDDWSTPINTNNGKRFDLSHITFYDTGPSSSTSSSGPSTGQAPEPASSMLALLGVGLLGASMWGRRRWNRS